VPAKGPLYMTCAQFSIFYSRPIACGRSRKVNSIVPPDPHRGFVAMHAGNGCSRTVNRFVIRLINWVTIERQSNRHLMASHLRRRPRGRPALWLTGTYVLATPVRALAVTATAVVLLSAAVSFAPMWDRAIFVKSVLEALHTNPALMQGL
jgi:hypothetical protein